MVTNLTLLNIILIFVIHILWHNCNAELLRAENNINNNKSPPLNKKNCFYYDLYNGGKILNTYKIKYVCEKIILNNDMIGDEKLMELAASISSSKKLNEIYIYKDTFTDKSLAALAKYLSNPSCGLKVLSLVKCNLNDESMKAFSENLHLSSRSKLVKLIVEENFLSAKGMAYLANALNTIKSKVTSLYFYKNKLTNKAAKSLGNLLTKNPSIQVLDITDNNLTKVGTNVLRKKIENKRNFKFGIETKNSALEDILQ